MQTSVTTDKKIKKRVVTWQSAETDKLLCDCWKEFEAIFGELDKELKSEHCQRYVTRLNVTSVSFYDLSCAFHCRIYEVDFFRWFAFRGTFCRAVFRAAYNSFS